MKYFYMNNVRGFTRALIPLRRCNFLVGENSTGKSSFLSLLNLVSKPDFYFHSRFALGDDAFAVGYSDLAVSLGYRQDLFRFRTCKRRQHEAR